MRSLQVLIQRAPIRVPRLFGSASKIAGGPYHYFATFSFGCYSLRGLLGSKYIHA